MFAYVIQEDWKGRSEVVDDFGRTDPIGWRETLSATLAFAMDGFVLARGGSGGTFNRAGVRAMIG
jgi:hypothetical protein